MHYVAAGMAKYWQFSSFSRHERLGEAAGRLQDAEKRLFMLPSMACQCSFSWLFCRPGQGASPQRVRAAEQGPAPPLIGPERSCPGPGRSPRSACPAGAVPLGAPVILRHGECHPLWPESGHERGLACLYRARQRKTAKEDARACSIFRARQESFFGRTCKTTSFVFLTMQDILSERNYSALFYHAILVY